jgi:tetratricopeptide (TPR) repeat protein
MSDRERLVEALGRAMRKAKEDEDPRWEALEKGELDKETVDELVRSAPMDPAREQALVDRALALHAAGEARPRPRVPKRARLAIALGLAAALAVAAVGVGLRRPETPPEYELQAFGDATTLGLDASPTAPVVKVSPGESVEITLTPKAASAAEVVARFFLVSGSDVRALPEAPRTGTNIKLTGKREKLFPNAPAGAFDLVALIALPGTTANEAELAEMARDPAREVPGFRAARRRIELLEDTDPPEVAEARRLRSNGELDEAEKRLAGAPEGLPKTRLAARLALDRNRLDEAERLFREAIQKGREARDIKGTGNDVLALAYVLLDMQSKTDEAAKLVDENKDILDAWVLGAADVFYTRGRIARAKGDVRAALADLREAAKQAEEVGPVGTRDPAKEFLADLLSTLGRHDEALAIARGITLPNDSSCREGQARNNVAWIELRAARAGVLQDVKEAVVLLERALEIARRSCPAGVGKVLTNLAIAKLVQGNEGLAEARKLVEEAKAAEEPDDPVDALWWAQIDAEAELAKGNADAALTHFEKMRAIAEGARLPEGALLGALGRARALDARGRVDDARRAFEDADRALDDWARAMPLGEGRGLFLAEQARLTRLRAEFLERRGSTAEMISALRRGATRYFALLDSPHPGDLPAEPPPLPEGTALLVAASLPGSGRDPASPVVLGAALGARAFATHVPSLAPSTWPALETMGPLGDLLRGARKVLVPAGDALRNVDVHAAMFEGKPLVARLPVAYTLNLTPLAEPARPPGATALLVVDPRMKEIRETITGLQTELKGRGFLVKVIETPSSTTAALRDAMEDPAAYVLYYAGHATFAGHDGLDTALTLTESAHFSVLDVLALKRVPPYVVLLACRSAGTDPAGDSLGLAQAFLIRGAQAAVASRVDLHVGVVEALGTRLVSGLGPTPDLPAALARAQAALSTDANLAATAGPSAWAALRALVR